jgi:DNA-binding transcriptional MerR regulator
MISVKLEEFIDTKNLDKLAELHELLSEEKLSAKDTGVNYRVINHWDEKGIIRFSREKKVSNRKYSFVDFIWIKVVNELRSFGVSLPVIQKIAEEIYTPLPLKDVFENFAQNLTSNKDMFKDFEGEDKEGFLEFFNSGEYKTADLDTFPIKFNFLQLLITEVIASRKSVALIVFSTGEWFPFIKDNEHLYPSELLYKKEFHSQVRVNITNLIFNFILEDYLIEYLNGLHLFTPQERKLLYYIKEGDYKKVFVIFKSKKNEPLEIQKSKTAQDELVRILREKEYKEFILVDKKNNEFRIRDTDKEEPKPLKERKILVKNDDPNSKRKFKVITVKE